MVSFEADYPSVWLKANKRPGDNRQESGAKVFTYPEENPPFRFVSIKKNAICQRAHSLSHMEMFHIPGKYFAASSSLVFPETRKYSPNKRK